MMRDKHIPYHTITEQKVKIPVDHHVQEVQYVDVVHERIREDIVDVPREIVDRLIEIRPVTNKVTV